MQFLISLITTFAVLVHAAFGCCWHHEHAWAPKETAAATSCGGHDHSHRDVCLGENQSDDSPCPHDDSGDESECEGLDCTFLATEKPPKQQGELSLNVPNVDSSVAGVPVPRQPLLRANHRDVTANAPLRAHLLFGVLLI